jgi:hypothetical protein
VNIGGQLQNDLVHAKGFPEVTRASFQKNKSKDDKLQDLKDGSRCAYLNFLPVLVTIVSTVMQCVFSKHICRNRTNADISAARPPATGPVLQLRHFMTLVIHPNVPQQSMKVCSTDKSRQNLQIASNFVCKRPEALLPGFYSGRQPPYPSEIAADPHPPCYKVSTFVQ